MFYYNDSVYIVKLSFFNIISITFKLIKTFVRQLSDLHNLKATKNKTNASKKDYIWGY